MVSDDKLVQEALADYETGDIASPEQALDEIAKALDRTAIPRHRLQEILALAYAGLRCATVAVFLFVPLCQPRPVPINAVPVTPEKQWAR